MLMCDNVNKGGSANVATTLIRVVVLIWRKTLMRVLMLMCDNVHEGANATVATTLIRVLMPMWRQR